MNADINIKIKVTNANSENTTIGEWSEPVVETNLTTKGGYWLVQVVDRDEDKALSEEDRDVLINDIYNQWFSEFQSQSAGSIGATGMTEDMRQMVIEKVLK